MLIIIAFIALLTDCDNSMYDKVLSNLLHKIRATSHYWSRLYDVFEALPPIESAPVQSESGGCEKRRTRPHSLSQLQVERGKLLELSLLMINTTAQWEVQLLSGR